MINHSHKYRALLVLGQLVFGCFVLFFMLLAFTPPHRSASIATAIPVYTPVATIIPTPVGDCMIQSCGDLGDAPDIGMMVYPTTSVTATFNTIYQAGTASGPYHQSPNDGPVLGEEVSIEKNAHQLPDEDDITNIHLATNTSDQDDLDDGVQWIKSLAPCQPQDFAIVVSKPPPYSNDVYVNVWFDFERDGDWIDSGDCGGVPVHEWAVQNQPLNLVDGSQVITLTITTYHPIGQDQDPIWMRISLSDTMAPSIGRDADGRGPATGYLYGETEDYYLKYYGHKGCGGCNSLAGWQG